jgi:hypothetical protein
MMKYIKIPIIITMLTFSSVVLGQKGKLLVAYDPAQMGRSNQVMIIYSNDVCNKGLLIKNDTIDFVFKGRILDEMRYEYILFSSYSESVGCITYYMFDIERNEIYASQAVLELEVPFFFSFDRNTLSMNLLSYDPLNCGKISKLMFILEKMQDLDLDFFKKLKIYSSINL